MTEHSGFSNIDRALRQYYADQGDTRYDEGGEGKFLAFCKEEGFEGDDIDDELADTYEDCGYLDFDPDFPLPSTLQNASEAEKQAEKFRILQNCHKYGTYRSVNDPSKSSGSTTKTGASSASSKSKSKSNPGESTVSPSKSKSHHQTTRSGNPISESSDILDESQFHNESNQYNQRNATNAHSKDTKQRQKMNNESKPNNGIPLMGRMTSMLTSLLKATPFENIADNQRGTGFDGNGHKMGMGMGSGDHTTLILMDQYGNSHTRIGIRTKPKKPKPIVLPKFFIIPPLRDEQMGGPTLTDSDDDDDDDDEEEDDDDDEEEERSNIQPRKVLIDLKGRTEQEILEQEGPEQPLYDWNQSDDFSGRDAFQKIDEGLSIYYEKMGRRDYMTDGGDGEKMGKFAQFVEDNGFDVEDIEEEFDAGPGECQYVDFIEDLEHFPLPTPSKDEDEIRLRIYKLLKYCAFRDAPPKSHVNDADMCIVNGYIRMEFVERLKMEIPQDLVYVVHQFYPKSWFFLSFEDDWDLKCSQKERDLIKVAMKEHLGAETHSIDALIAMMALSRKPQYGYFPLMQYLFDAFTRSKVAIFLKFGYNKRLSNCFPSHWLQSYAFGQHLKRINGEKTFSKKEGIPPVFHWMMSSLRLYTMDAVFPSIFPTSLAIKHRLQIQDDLYPYFHFGSAAIQFINTTTTGGVVPWQFDLTIFPNKIFVDDGRVYLDRRTPILTPKTDIIGDIGNRLDFGNIDFVERELSAEELTTKRVLTAIQEMFAELKSISKSKGKRYGDYPCRRRVCCIVDRRCESEEEEGDRKKDEATHRVTAWNKNTIYLFNAVNGALPKQRHFIPEIYHQKTKEILLPSTDGVDDEGVRVRDHCGITLSFHCENINQIKCYLWWDGHGMRFQPQDLNTFIPVWFDDDYIWKEMKGGERYKKFMADEAVQREIDSLSIKDLHFMDFKRAWSMKRSKQIS